MQLYSDDSQYSHQIRYTLAEKSVTAVIHPVDIADNDSAVYKNFVEVNPRMTLPSLMDRDVVLTHSPVILEYLEERYPYPALLPPLPVEKANVRERMHRIYDEMLVHADVILTTKRAAQADKARKALDNSVSWLSRNFANWDWCLSPNFSLLDCCIAPLLWRLDILGIKVKQKTQSGAHLLRYMNNVFEREAFMGSLTQAEREMR